MRGGRGRQASSRREHYDGPASRAKILALIRDDPGINVDEIAHKAGLSWHTTAYHLSLLERMGNVVIEKRARDRCVFLRQVPTRHRAWFVALRPESAESIVRALLASRRQGIQALAQRLACTEKVVRRRLADLEQAGVVVRIGTWRPVYEVKPAVRRPIAALLPGRGPAFGPDAAGKAVRLEGTIEEFASRALRERHRRTLVPKRLHDPDSPDQAPPIPRPASAHLLGMDGRPRRPVGANA